MPTLRAAIDTSIVWTALASQGGVAFRVVQAWYASRYELVYTDETVAEYRTELLDADYIAKYDNDMDVEEFFALVDWFGLEVEPAPVEALPPIRDDRDRKWLGCAVGGECNYLVTDDHDFLEDPPLVRAMRTLGVRVVTPSIYLRELDRL